MDIWLWLKACVGWLRLSLRLLKFFFADAGGFAGAEESFFGGVEHGGCHWEVVVLIHKLLFICFCAVFFLLRVCFAGAAPGCAFG
jgi:hypothetical protein